MPSSVLVSLSTMGKPKKVVKKRCFRGNQYSKTSCDVSVSEEPSTSRPRFEDSDSSGESVDVGLDLEQSQPVSSSASSILKSRLIYKQILSFLANRSFNSIQSFTSCVLQYS